MAVSQIYTLVCNYESENINSDSFSKRRFFEKDERVVGDYYLKENILIDGRYPIPLDCLKTVSPNDYKQKKSEKKYPINSPFYSNKSTKEKVRFITLGACIGAGSGYLLASYLGKNKTIFTIGGFLVGMYVQNWLVKKEPISKFAQLNTDFVKQKENIENEQSEQ